MLHKDSNLFMVDEQLNIIHFSLLQQEVLLKKVIASLEGRRKTPRPFDMPSHKNGESMLEYSHIPKEIIEELHPIPPKEKSS